MSIKGEVKRVVFRSEETGFSVFVAESEGKKITCTGYVPVREGLEILMEGEWVEHPKYGPQFQVKNWELCVPIGIEAIARFLEVSVNGIGPKMAAKIVEVLGDQAIDRIVHEGEAALLHVPGIGKKKAKEIAEQVRQGETARRAMTTMLEWGLTPSLAAKAIQRFGDQVVVTIQSNPYRLVELDYVGFATADSIARKIGVPETSRFRIASALFHVLEMHCSTGHAWMPRQAWITACKELLDNNSKSTVPAELVDNVALDMEAQRFVVTELGGEAVFLKHIWEAEKIVASWVAPRCMVEKVFPRGLHALIESYEKESGITLSTKQKEAVLMALVSPFMILTGGPGTGKTTTLKAIIWCYSKLHPDASIGMCAPTGRAARRLEEVTGVEAKTIHRMLGFSPGNREPQYSEDRPLPHDFIVIDEVSMMDILLARRIFGAIRHSKVVLVGDVDQLPSVGPGHVLHDLIEAGVPCVRLDVIFRQAQTSNIVLNAHRIIQGKRLESGKDFWFVPVDGKTSQEANPLICSRLELAIRNLLQKGYTADQIQVLSPSVKSDLGTEELNRRLQNLLNPPEAGKPEIRFGKQKERIWRLGDKVIQNKNNYDKFVFNGEIGYIVGVNPEEETLEIQFGDAIHVYTRHEFGEIQHAYAITIHKSQGGEYPVVLIPLSTSHYVMLYRNLIYTGVTRAKQLCGIIGMPKALAIAIRQNKPVQRNTMLVERIISYAEQRKSAVQR